jgi:glycosyltransferase involved in cell wall biosynthesis
MLMVGPFPPPEGGWSTAIREEREALELRGIECAVLNLGPRRKERSGEYVRVRNGFDLFAKLAWFSSRGYVFRLHMNGDSPKGMIIVLASEMLNLLFFKRPCLSFHAGVEQRHFPDRGNPFLKLVWSVIFNVSKVVVCDHEAVKNLIVLYKADRGGVYAVSPFSPARARFRPARLSSEREAFVSSRKPLLFSYFAYRPEYDLDTFFEVLARLKSAMPGFGCVVVDDRSFPDSSVMSRAREAIAEKELEGSVLLVGHVDRNEFLTLLGRSDLFVRTPATDGVCSSVLESLSLGVPVVAAGNACRPETVITYAPGNAGDLYSKLVNAVERLEELRETVRAGRVAAEDGAERLAGIIEERYWPQ